MNEPTIWLTEDDVRAMVSLNDAMASLEEAIAMEAAGAAQNIDKALGVWSGRRSMHALGSMMPLKGYVGFKTWVNTPDGAAAIFALFGADSGMLLALMEASSLGQLRTAGISGVATARLARPDAEVMALVGTGRQAAMQVAAVATRIALTKLKVYSPTEAKRAAFVARAREMFSFAVEDCGTLENAVEGASIVTLITRASEPFLESSMLARGAHLNAAGAILPANSEFTQSVFDRASLVVVDSVGNARKASSELIARYGDDDDAWRSVVTLGSLVRGETGRPDNADVTLFKPMGMGLSDLAVAIRVYEAARHAGIGTPMPKGARGPLRWSVKA